MTLKRNEYGSGRVIFLILLLIVIATGTFVVTALLININERKNEAATQFQWITPVDENTTDPEVWGSNFPSELSSYKKTDDYSPKEPGGAPLMAEQKLDKDPWLKRLYAGYAFSLDYRAPREHPFMLFDQENTRRVKEKKQPGACLQCHASIIPAYRFAGKGDVMKGFELVCAMPFQDAHDLKDEKGNSLVKFPANCVDCHTPGTMKLRVTRPALIYGMRALKASQGIKDYDINRDASWLEMRTFVCAQCHVEYHFKGDGKLLTYPWFNGIKMEEIEKYYDDEKFVDWSHGETSAGVIKAQHPDFEMWSQGVHGRSGVTCADCHMPYMREGSRKVSDHWVRSPLETINRSCQTCHNFPESELNAKIENIQNKNNDLLKRTAKAYTDMLDAIVAAKQSGATDEQLAPILALQRKAQWRLDFVSSANSKGFHAPQEAARILSESIDYSRQAEIAASKLAKTQ